MLRQLKRDGNIRRHVNRFSVTGGRPESYLLSHPASLFIEAVAKPMHDALHQHLACGSEGNAQDDISLDSQLFSFRGVLNGRFG
jgi:hypothetical protein